MSSDIDVALLVLYECDDDDDVEEVYDRDGAVLVLDVTDNAAAKA